jgi:hypothetical protein
MKKPVIYIFIAYVWSKTLFGLTVTPYKSIREITRNKVLVPVVLSPVIGLIALFVIGRILALILHPGGFYRSLIALSLSTALISILLWQLLLIYLLMSFYFGLKKQS